MAIANMPYALSTKSQTAVGGEMIIPVEEFKEEEKGTGALVSIINVNSAQKQKTDTAIQKYVDEHANLTVVSKKKFVDEFNNLVRTVQIIGFALAAVFATIGIINFCNTMITSIYKRSKEFAIMQAVGLSNHQLIGILTWEGILYGIFAMLSSIILHFLIGQKIIQLLAGQLWMFEYQTTIFPIFLSLPLVLVFAIDLGSGMRTNILKINQNMQVTDTKSEFKSFFCL